MPRSLNNALKRRLSIAENVREKGDANVNELAEWLGVTTATIRTDLQYLEDQGYLIRSFGGARRIDDAMTSTDSFNLLAPRFRQTFPLAYQAALQVKGGEHLFLGGAGLVQQMGVLLSAIPELRITTDAPALVSLQNQTPLEAIHLTGGYYDSETGVLCGWGEKLSCFCQEFDCSFIELGGDPNLHHPACDDYIALCSLSERNIGIIQHPGIAKEHIRVLEHLTEVMLLTELSETWDETLKKSGFQQQQILEKAVQFKRTRFRDTS